MLTGTGIPGTTVTLHFHRAGTAATDYSVLRTATVSASGTWYRAFVPSVDHRVYVTGVNGLRSATYLVQVR